MSATPTLLPGLRGRGLSGRTVHLPTDLPSDPTVFVAGFVQQQQRDIDRWAAALPDVEVLEVVLLSTRQARRRRFIEAGMALGIREPAVRARTWCLYGDLDELLTRLGVPDRSVVLAIVGSPSGAQHAMAVGPPTGEAVRAVHTAARRSAAP